MGRPGCEQHELIGEQDRFSRIVGNEDRRRRALRPNLEQKMAQAVGGALIERDEGLVEQQQVGMRREGAGQGHAARKPKRQLLRVARQHVGDADRRGETLELGVRHVLGDDLDILPNRAPGKQPRLLEHDADARVVRHVHLAGEAIVEAGDDAQQRGLAATRRAHQHRHTLRLHLEHHVADGGDPRPVRPDMGLLLDVDLKPACCASGSYVVQGAAPANIRLRA